MPNTLAHIAVHGAANASWQPARYLPWVLLGCVLPDVPWIANRVLRAANPAIDVVALDLYCFFNEMCSVQTAWHIRATIRQNPSEALHNRVLDGNVPRP